MKTLKITVFVLVCLLSANLAFGSEKEDLEKEIIEIINKIRTRVSNTQFTSFVKCEKPEQMVLRCKVNENCEVYVSKIIGFNADLKEAVRKRVEKKVIKTSAAMCGQEFAFRLYFKKYDR